MTPKNQLKLFSAAIALIWTVAMIVWSGDYDAVNVVIMSVGGVVFAFAWYGIFGFLMKRASRNDPAAGR